jgi:hypothetical protein
MTPSLAAADAEAVARTTDAAQWTTLTIEAEADQEPATPLTVGVGFTTGTRPGAALWCDEATLVEVRGPG